jgi:hypothetical protein
MPVPVYRRSTTVIMLAPGRLQKPAMRESAPRSSKMCRTMTAQIPRIKPNDRRLLLDLELFGIPRSNDATRVPGDLRCI